MEEPVIPPTVMRFMEITLPALVKEMARMNENVERALDYYATEQRVPERAKKST
jgi:hypothetical protein